MRPASRYWKVPAGARARTPNGLKVLSSRCEKAARSSAGAGMANEAKGAAVAGATARERRKSSFADGHHPSGLEIPARRCLLTTAVARLAVPAPSSNAVGESPVPHARHLRQRGGREWTRQRSKGRRRRKLSCAMVSTIAESARLATLVVGLTPPPHLERERDCCVKMWP